MEEVWYNILLKAYYSEKSFANEQKVQNLS